MTEPVDGEGSPIGYSDEQERFERQRRNSMRHTTNTRANSMAPPKFSDSKIIEPPRPISWTPTAQNDQLPVNKDFQYTAVEPFFPYKKIQTIVPTIVNVQAGPQTTIQTKMFTSVNMEGTTVLSVPERTLRAEDKKKQEGHYQSQEFLDHLNMVTIQVAEEFKTKGPIAQFKRDAKLWKLTLEEPEVPALGSVLRRVFTILRYGGFMYRTHEKLPHNHDPNSCDPTEWKWWHESGIPIASAMSHGSRVIIQLPKKQSPRHEEHDEGVDDYFDPQDSVDEHCHAFWKWLLTGNPKGDVSKMISTATNGNEARRTNRIMFKRLGATHALQYQQHEQVVITPPNTPKKKVPGNGQYGDLPGGRRKVLLETKTVGITFRDTKVFRGDEHVLKHHRHWGMNVPVGGAGYHSLTGKLIECNGEHGHMYIYYMSPKYSRYGGLMIGVEGSEYGKHDQGGGYHGLSARSPLFSPTFGYKWRGKDKHGDENKKPDLGELGPTKYNGMLVDLTGSGWTFLMEKEQEWKNEYVTETSCPVSDILPRGEVPLQVPMMTPSKSQEEIKYITPTVVSPLAAVEQTIDDLLVESGPVTVVDDLLVDDLLVEDTEEEQPVVPAPAVPVEPFQVPDMMSFMQSNIEDYW